ncbi:MAG: hypothetical protein J6C46_11705 [Clostridia bacterium]|nr:hypothetical protein [Clostridia bacterium]
MNNSKQLALEFRKALEFFIYTLDAEADIDKILEIPSMYPKYKVGVNYKAKEIFSHGVNAVGDPQLYLVLVDHTSQEDWTPENSSSLYKAIGISESGIPIWVQPLGASDAYNTGDIVMYNGICYRSLIDGNVWAPDVYPAGWEVVENVG